MDAKQINAARRRLAMESEKLVQSIKRTRMAAEEITTENTEDECDLATISQNRELLYNLHENDLAHLNVIQESIKALDRGRYGECVRCEDTINEKRLFAMPWATLCIRCQEETEMEHVSSREAFQEPNDLMDF